MKFQPWVFLPYLVIVFICLVFFYPVFIQGKVPLPADHPLGIYYPWLDYKWPGYPYGVPVKNPIAADVVSFMYPMQILAVDQLKSGQIPLWNPLIFAGAPLLANFQSAPFSPTIFLYWLFSNLDAWTSQIIIQPILGAVFLFWLLRYFKRSYIASIMGGVIYAFSGFMMIWLEWNGHSLVSAFFPLIILLTLKLYETKKVIYGVILSLVLGLQFFSGYPQIIIYEFVSLGIALIIWDFKRLQQIKNLARIGLFLILGIGVAMIQILPAYELITLSQREVELVQPEWSLLRLRSVITFFAPDYFGNHASYNYWGPADYTQSVGFSGIVAITLASLGVITSFKKKAVKIALAWVVFTLLYTFDNPLSRAIYQSGFLSSQAASAHRSLILSNLGVAVLAAFGIDAILSQRANLKNLIRALYLPGIIIASYLIGSLVIFFWLRFVLTQPLPEDLLFPLKDITVGLRNLVIPSGLLIILFLSFLIISFKKKLTFLITLLICFLAIFELFRFGWKFTPFMDKSLVFPQTPILKYLQDQPGVFRVNVNEIIPVNLMMPYGIETIEGYDAVYPLRFSKYISVLNSNTPNSPLMGRYGLVSNPNSNLLDYANVKYVLTLKKNDKGEPGKNGKILFDRFDKNYRPVFEDGSVVVLENIDSFERAFMVYDWEVESEEIKTYDKIISNKKIVLNKDPQIQKTSTGQSRLNLDSIKNFGDIIINSDNPGILYIANSLYPGWKAKVDGQETEIILANNNFMAIPIKKPGETRVNLYYNPSSFERGKMISLLSLALLFLISLFGIFKKYVKKNSTRNT